MNDELLRDEINKRLTLNWLIQGAAQHAGMTFHHLVADELNSLDPRLLRLYDQFALVILMQYWHVDSALVLGTWPPWFWRHARSKRSHPFFSHPLLSSFGGTLAAAVKKRALERCKDKGVTSLPILFPFQSLFVLLRLHALEAHYRFKLIALAKKATSKLWGIPVDRLHGELMKRPGVAKRLVPGRTIRAAILRALAAGYGGAARWDGSLTVYGKGRNWWLLTHELVKGTAELICLHGLQGLDDETYKSVMKAADRIEFEPPMLQTGGELWRRLLTVLPEGRSVAYVLMQLAQLPPNALETLIRAVIEHPDRARELLARMEDEPRTVRRRMRTVKEESEAVKAILPMSFPLSERARSRSRLVRRIANVLRYGCVLAFGMALVRGCIRIFLMEAVDAYGKTVMALMATLLLACAALWAAFIFQGSSAWNKRFSTLSGGVCISATSVQAGTETIDRSSIASVRQEGLELIIRYRRDEKLCRFAIPMSWLPPDAADQICEALRP
jgi:hypothetical protein